jgi:hypothetical protein
VKIHEAALQVQAKEIKMLKDELSELEKMIFKLNVKGMCFLCMYVLG